MAFDAERLLPLIRCPRTKSRLVYTGDAFVCTDPECRLRFEIRDDIPNLIPEDATTLMPEEWHTAMQRAADSP